MPFSMHGSVSFHQVGIVALTAKQVTMNGYHWVTISSEGTELLTFFLEDEAYSVRLASAINQAKEELPETFVEEVPSLDDEIPF